MDLREKKTRRSIHRAFLQLRRDKPLEKITVKELAQLAEISKATFYLHYRDIYDLSDALEDQLIQDIISGIPQPERFRSDPAAFTHAMCNAFYDRQAQIDILFSGNQAAALPLRLEQALRSYLHHLLPQPDLRGDMLLTYQILGAHGVYQTYHRSCSIEEVLSLIAQISQAISQVCY